MGARQSCGKACSNCTADCTRPAQGYGDDFDDERPGGDPAGATFEETLEDLNSLDRHLMLFCATSNLSAVRWLLHLGAHWDACDANGTTCLHVACRAGALSVVKELMTYKQLLEATDTAGWTTLHIAVLMGRREVVVRLLQAGAPAHQRNNKGQMPAELCADNGTFEALRSYELHQQQSPGKPWQFCKDTGPGEDIIGSRLQYEPFFVPRQAVIRSQQYKKEFQRIGTLMFNQQPGYGLAFLVASGVARDYPVDMSTFLRRSKVDIRQVGSFLGEAFSLSHTIRLEFVNSVVLQNTGVVSALARVFHMLQLPDDLQKINRLVHGVARIWWRQHERMVKDLPGQANPGAARKERLPAATQPTEESVASEELTGLELKQYLTSSDVLHQLMFSTVLLHWYIHKDGNGLKKEMDFSVWKRLNQGVEADGTDVPEHVQHRVHSIVSRSFIVELSVATASSRNRGDAAAGGAGHGPDEGGGHGLGDEGWAASVATERPRSPVLSLSAAIEGWAQIVGGGFPKPSGLTGVQTVTYRHMSNIFSEVTNSSAGVSTSPLGFQGSGSGDGGAGGVAGPKGVVGGAGHAPSAMAEATPSGARRDDFAWLSICYTLLFFSASPSNGAPYAFVELSRVRIAHIQNDARIITLVGIADPDDVDADLAAAGGVPGGASAAEAAVHAGKGNTHITIVLLLPDGRWQELPLPSLDLRVPTDSELGMWGTHLTAASQGKTMRPSPSKTSPSLSKGKESSSKSSQEASRSQLVGAGV